MPRHKEACKRCDSKTPGAHEPSCRYAKLAHPKPVAPLEYVPSVRQPPAKIRKRVFTIDHADGSETTITVRGPAGAVKCNSTEQSVQVWTGEVAPALPHAHPAAPPRAAAPYSADVARSGEEYTETETLDDVPGGTMGLTEEEMMDPNVVLERMRRGMIGRMSAETASSDTILVPGDN